jgi:hypothetical protein
VSKQQRGDTRCDGKGRCRYLGNTDIPNSAWLVVGRRHNTRSGRQAFTQAHWCCIQHPIQLRTRHGRRFRRPVHRGCGEGSPGEAGWGHDGWAVRCRQHPAVQDGRGVPTLGGMQSHRVRLEVPSDAIKHLARGDMGKGSGRGTTTMSNDTALSLHGNCPSNVLKVPLPTNKGAPQQ